MRIRLDKYLTITCDSDLEMDYLTAVLGDRTDVTFQIERVANINTELVISLTADLNRGNDGEE